MAAYILWSALTCTLRGLLCAWRFLWVSPFCAVKSVSGTPHEMESSQRPHANHIPGPRKCDSPGQERSLTLQERLAEAEREIQALKSQISLERSLWERRFLDLQRQQRGPHQLSSKSGVRCNASDVEEREMLPESRPEKGGMTVSPWLTGSADDTTPNSLTVCQVSLPAFSSRSDSALSVNTSPGSWRSAANPHRVFVPHSPRDLQIGHRVRVLLPSGRISSGTLRYLGQLEGSGDIHLGVELEAAEGGCHDGTHEGQSYFECMPGYGAFVTFSKLLMAWE